MSYFAAAYKATFGFEYGPPLHDALTIAYVSQPDLFKCKRYRVDVELAGAHTTGETVVDIWDYRGCDDTWGPTGKNCMVAETLNVSIFTVSILICGADPALQVDGFFDLLLDCIARCDVASPLNTKIANS